MKLKGVFVAAMLLMPTAALAAPGLVTASVGMRAGPGPGFPMVSRIPGGARVDIHGCVKGDAWCDVSWSADRGWVSSQYLKYLYQGRYVYLPDYVDVIDVPVVPFVLGSYWANYYSGRPWYHRRAHWDNYWRSHARFATQTPVNRSNRFRGAETRTAVPGRQTRAGVAPGGPRQSFANVRGARGPQGRMAPANGAARAMSRAQQPIAQGRAARFSGAPAVGRAMPAQIARPNVGRTGGSPPMGAHAQMGAPRAAPAMPHPGGGGAPHINAAPGVGAPGHRGR